MSGIRSSLAVSGVRTVLVVVVVVVASGVLTVVVVVAFGVLTVAVVVASGVLTVVVVVSATVVTAVGAVPLPNQEKSNVHYSRCTTPKRVTTGGAHLRGLASQQHSYEKTPQRRDQPGNCTADLPHQYRCF